MNLLVPVIWSVLIISSVSIPRPRHRHTKYPVNKLGNPILKNGDQTALQILEKSLLRQNQNKMKKRSSKNKRSENLKHLLKHTHPTFHFHNETGDFSINKAFNGDLEDYTNSDSCFSAFGEDSPLCKPRKTLQKPSKHFKRSFRSDISPARSTIEDFFGVFANNSSLNFTEETKNNRNFNITEHTSSTPTLHYSEIKNNTTNFLSTMPITVKPKTTPHRELIAEKYKPVFENTAQTFPEEMKIKEKEIMARLQLDSNLLKDNLHGSPKRNLKDYYKQDDEGESGGVGEHLPDHSDQETTEENSEYEATEANSDETVSAMSDEETETDVHHTPTTDKSLLSSSTFDKSRCESEYGKKCVCSFISLSSDFHTIFSMARNPTVALREVSRLRCRHYIPAPAHFELSSHLKPKVLSANRKPMSVDGGNGSKEIDQQSLDSFIEHASSENDDLAHVFVNSDVKLPCFPTSDVHLSPNDAGHVKYKWTHGNKKAITEGRITENADGDGALLIEDVSLTDSDNYTCELDYIHPDSGHRTEETFTHSLSVVTLPTMTARVMVHYKAGVACDASLLELFELYLPQQVEEALCENVGSKQRLCWVELHSPVCHSETSDNSQDRVEREAQVKPLNKPYWLRQKREDSMEMSLNFEVYIHRTAERSLSVANSTLCSAICHLVICLKLLQLFKESMTEIALTPVKSLVEDVKGIFNPVSSSVKIKYIFGCIGGYHLKNGFCVACPQNTFSEDGATECAECPPNTYQNVVGARSCTSCANAWIPYCNEAFEKLNITMIIIVFCVLLVIVILLVLWYVFKVKHKNLTDVKKWTKKDRVTSRKVKIAKGQKYLNKSKKKKEAKQLNDLLESSTGESDNATDSEVEESAV